MTFEPDAIRPGCVVEVWDRPRGRFQGRFRVADAGPGRIRVEAEVETSPAPFAVTIDEVRPISAQSAQP